MSRSLVGLPISLASYIGILGVGALALFAWALPRVDPALWLTVGLLLFVAVAADLFSLPLPRGGDLHVSTLVWLVGVLILPPPAAIVLVFLGTVGGDLLARKVWYRLAFNVGQLTIAVAAASLLWTGATSGLVNRPEELLDTLPWALLALATYYVLNTSLLSGVLSLSGSGPIVDVWLANYRSVLLPHLGMHVMGLLFAGAWLADPRAVVLLAVPGGVTWASFRHIRSLEATSAEERRLRTDSERLVQRWAALAEASARLGSTVAPDDLLRISAELLVGQCCDAACVGLRDGRSGTAVRAGVRSPDSLVRDVLAAAGKIRQAAGFGRPARRLPVLAGGEEIGTIDIMWADASTAESSETLLGPLVERIALALHNALLVEQSAEVETLRQVGQMKSEFLAAVGHELRTPLALIVGYGELLQQPPPQNQVTWMGHRILHAGQQLARLVDDLLDAGRLETGRFALERKQLDLVEIVDTTIEVARAARPDHRYALRTTHSSLRAEADPNRIQQVLTNLLSNAARYSPAGGQITIRLERVYNEALIAVEDQGPGVPAAERERVFDKFYRAPGAEAHAVNGLGLGLAIARDIVAAHGGRIWIEDAPEGGARFVFTLPLQTDGEATGV